MLIVKRAAAAFAVGVVFIALAATPAAACSGAFCDDDGGADPDASGGTLAIRVWGSGTTNGDTGGFDVPLETVRIHPTCWYYEGPTGEEYADYIESGQINWDRRHFGEEIPEISGWEEHADDDEGHWWYRVCNSGYFDGDLDEFFDYSEQWFDDNPPIFVEPGDPEPEIAVPPEVLMEVAYNAMDIPEPTLAWNPSRGGDTATFVNFDTWVWLDDSPITLEVNAEAGGNVATVTATLDSMTASAPTAEPASCAGAGLPWTPDADAEAGCQIVFTRSSANQPGQATPVTVETTWTVTWSANGVPQGSLEPQTLATVTDVPVAEVQTIVTGG
ncbi:MAG TPA: hypothetical protein VFZ37_10895 [Jiangellaceae bacterium]